MQVEIIPSLQDNFAYLLHDGREAVVIDPADAAPVRAVLDRLGLVLRRILVTHNHWDHVAGVAALAAVGGVRIAAPSREGLERVDDPVGDGGVVDLGFGALRVLATPGHLQQHVAYWEGAGGHLFCGDTLFVSGCGRLLGCTPGVFWSTLVRLRELPDATQVYCGHDYALDNMAFALATVPGDSALEVRRADWLRRLEGGAPGVPSCLGDEKRGNLFLRADDPQVQSALGLTGAPAVDVFAELRRRKDRWR